MRDIIVNYEIQTHLRVSTLFPKYLCLKEQVSFIFLQLFDITQNIFKFKIIFFSLHKLQPFVGCNVFREKYGFT